MNSSNSLPLVIESLNSLLICRPIAALYIKNELKGNFVVDAGSYWNKRFVIIGPVHCTPKILLFFILFV